MPVQYIVGSYMSSIKCMKYRKIWFFGHGHDILWGVLQRRAPKTFDIRGIWRIWGVHLWNSCQKECWISVFKIQHNILLSGKLFNIDLRSCSDWNVGFLIRYLGAKKPNLSNNHPQKNCDQNSQVQSRQLFLRDFAFDSPLSARWLN